MDLYAKEKEFVPEQAFIDQLNQFLSNGSIFTTIPYSKRKWILENEKLVKPKYFGAILALLDLEAQSLNFLWGHTTPSMGVGYVAHNSKPKV
jgi:hypothetical protein